MKRSLLLFLSSILIAAVAGCTSYQHFEFREDMSNYTERDDGIWIYVPIQATKSSNKIIPLIYDEDIYKEPYSCFFTIWGNFDEITAVTAFFILNGQPQSSLPLSLTKMNNGTTINQDGRNLFSDGRFDLPFQWDEVESLKIKIKFSALDRDGEIVEYEEIKTFKKELWKSKGNRTVDKWMSV